MVTRESTTVIMVLSGICLSLLPAPPIIVVARIVSCPTGFFMDSSGTICLKFTEEMPMTSIDYTCNMVEIFTDSMRRTLEGVIDQDKHYWIGMEYDQGLRQYKYGNGTILHDQVDRAVHDTEKEKTPDFCNSPHKRVKVKCSKGSVKVATLDPFGFQLYNMTRESPDTGVYRSVSPEPKPFCISMGIGQWLARPCTANLSAICEFNDKEQVQVGDVGTAKKDDAKNETTTTACSLDLECVCDEKDWTVLQNPDSKETKYIFVNWIKTDFADARVICQRLGANLYLHRDPYFQHALKETNVSGSHMGTLYWMGAYYNQLVEEWRIVDEEMLDVGWWGIEQTNMTDCAVSIWDYRPQIHLVDCKQKLPHVCESPVPCQARPYITVDEGLDLRSPRNETVLNRNHVSLRCFLGGYPHHVLRIHLTCPVEEKGRVRIMDYQEKSVTMSVRMDESLHGLTCRCEALKLQGFSEVAEVTLFYKTQPSFIDANLNYESFTVQENFATFVDLLANPPPFRFNMTKDGEYFPDYKYVVNVYSMPGNFHYNIRVDLIESTVGKYKFVMDNGVPDSLKYYFTIKEDPSAKYVLSASDVTSVAVVFLILLFLGRIFLLLLLIIEIEVSIASPVIYGTVNSPWT